MLDEGVVALVLTFNSPANLLTCLSAIGHQTTPPARVLVIENASSARVDFAEAQRVAGLPLELVSLSENLGPAGGYAEGLRRAELMSGDLVWIMDDDVVPDGACLEYLQLRMRRADSRALVFPESFDLATGEQCSTWGWCGLLMPKTLIGIIGLPRAALFYGSEDQDYLIDRAGVAGFPLTREPAATVALARRAHGRPAWHYYYLPRNAVYQHLYRRGHVPFARRMKRLAWGLMVLARGIDGGFRARTTRFALMALGISHGAFRMLGRRLEPRDAQRPSMSSS